MCGGLSVSRFSLPTVPEKKVLEAAARSAVAPTTVVQQPPAIAGKAIARLQTAGTMDKLNQMSRNSVRDAEAQAALSALEDVVDGQRANDDSLHEISSLLKEINTESKATAADPFAELDKVSAFSLVWLRLPRCRDRDRRCKELARGPVDRRLREVEALIDEVDMAATPNTRRKNLEARMARKGGAAERAAPAAVTTSEGTVPSQVGQPSLVLIAGQLDVGLQDAHVKTLAAKQMAEQTFEKEQRRLERESERRRAEAEQRAEEERMALVRAAEAAEREAEAAAAATATARQAQQAAQAAQLEAAAEAERSRQRADAEQRERRLQAEQRDRQLREAAAAAEAAQAALKEQQRRQAEAERLAAEQKAAEVGLSGGWLVAPAHARWSPSPRSCALSWSCSSGRRSAERARRRPSCKLAWPPRLPPPLRRPRWTARKSRPRVRRRTASARRQRRCRPRPRPLTCPSWSTATCCSRPSRPRAAPLWAWRRPPRACPRPRTSWTLTRCWAGSTLTCLWRPHLPLQPPASPPTSIWRWRPRPRWRVTRASPSTSLRTSTSTT